MPGAFVAVVLIIAVIATVASITRRAARSTDLIDQWAQNEGVTVVNREARSLLRGPFSFTTTKGQTVYYVTVQDGDGKTRHAWIKCGGAFMGLMSDQVKVQWED